MIDTATHRSVLYCRASGRTAELPRRQVLVGDALMQLRRLPSGSVDTCITSPPYYQLRRYGVEGQIGLEADVQAWVTSLAAVFAEVARVLKSTGSLWLNLGDSYSRHDRYGAPPKGMLCAPERLLLSLASSGWLVRNKVIWAKPNPMPASVGDRLNTAHEFVYFLVRFPRYQFDLDTIREPHKSRAGRKGREPLRAPEPWAGPLAAGSQDGLRRARPAGQPGHVLGKNPGDVWMIPTRGFRGAHFATFPEQLVVRPLLATCPEAICTRCGQPPESSMVETILSAVDEYQSTRSGADIAYKMGAKAKSGGTLGRARLGYLNCRDTSAGRNIGTVVIDEERAPLVRTAFRLYATGDYTLEALQDELTARGLTTRPGRYPAGPVSTSKLASLLRDPYYIGYVTYKGELFAGRHEPLISRELFERVQAVLDERSGNGQRQRRHHHYLKGMLWCGACHDAGIESRMILQWSKGNGGLYLYFFCRRKQTHACESRYLDGEMIEEAVIDAYRSLHFEIGLADRLRGLMDQALAEREESTRLLNKQLRAELARLDRQETNLIELAAEGSRVVEKVRQKLGDIQRRRDQVSERLATSDDQLQVGRRMIESGLALLDNPQERYRRMDSGQRRLMNDAFFEKLYVYDDRTVEVMLRSPFGDLLGAQELARRAPRATAHRGRANKLLTRPWTASDNQMAQGLAAVLCGDGSNKGLMVEVKGLEPSASTLRT